MLITRLMSALPYPYTPSDTLIAAIRRSFWGFVVGGMVVVILTGLHQLTSGGIGLYMKQGWFHTKLTLVIVLIVVTAVVGNETAITKKGLPVSRKRMLVCHAITGMILVLAVLLTKVVGHLH